MMVEPSGMPSCDDVLIMNGHESPFEVIELDEKRTVEPETEQIPFRSEIRMRQIFRSDLDAGGDDDIVAETQYLRIGTTHFHSVFSIGA
ncbi:hypothetical protein BLNAU_19065 [Blattamonas nauphoetae]|uniref:Uncharacterized protein n=1 Tax=Blattamonas nauphoetae TaxID=2049346 RepID=A0ABQ9X2I9_9EUKA|nr:hypothetical protein BLNAU_19065 [Blattamonas nauphoetae]